MYIQCIQCAVLSRAKIIDSSIYTRFIKWYVISHMQLSVAFAQVIFETVIKNKMFGQSLKERLDSVDLLHCNCT